MAKTEAPLETGIIDRASRFEASIFLGTGRYFTAAFGTLREAREAAAAFAATARNGRSGMVYAIAEGRSIFVPDTYHPAALPADNQEPAAMTETPAAAAPLNAVQIAMLSAVVTGGAFKRSNSRDAAIARLRKIAAGAGIEGARIDAMLSTPFAEAQAALRAALAAGKPGEPASQAPQAPQAPQAAVEAPAAPAPAEAPAAKPARAEGGKRAAIQDAARRGELPAAPDFAANTHKPFRKKLDAVIALAEAGDIAGLKAFAINPVSSSPKAIARYRDLAVIALEARAAMVPA